MVMRLGTCRIKFERDCTEAGDVFQFGRFQSRDKLLMPQRLEPLPLENRRVDDGDRALPPRRLKMTAVALASHIGLCIAAIALPIFIALVLVPAPPAVAWFHRSSAIIGATAMAALPVICIGLIVRKPWSRRAMIGFAWFEMVWESVKLLLTVFFFAPVYKRLMTDELARQLAAAASTQPTTQPTAFASFTSYGIYIMALVTWLIFFGYAFGSWKAMNTPAAKDALRG